MSDYVEEARKEVEDFLRDKLSKEDLETAMELIGDIVQANKQ